MTSRCSGAARAAAYASRPRDPKAAQRGATAVTIAATLVEGSVVITVEDDGSDRTSSLTSLADRVGAVGGDLVLEHGASERRSVRVVVADDAMLTREGIVRLLRDANVEVVAEAEDADALLASGPSVPMSRSWTSGCRPPTDEGLVAALAIRADHPEVGVLVLSQYVEPSYAMRLIRTNQSASAICSRIGCRTSRSWSMRSAGSWTARPSSTRRSSRASSGGGAARTHSRG